MLNVIQTETSHESIHPLACEGRHDDTTTSLFALAKELVEAQNLPQNEKFNPYYKLQEVMYNYVGDPSTDKRTGLHVMPDVNRDTRRGPRMYSLGCASLFNPETGELCIVRKDPNVDSADSTDWMVLRYSIKTGDFREDIVVDSKNIRTRDSGGDVITLELAQDKPYQGLYHLTFTVNQNYHSTGEPAVLSHKKYYGRGVGEEAESMIDDAFTDDISVLFEKVNLEKRLFIEPALEPVNQLPATVGRVAVEEPYLKLAA